MVALCHMIPDPMAGSFVLDRFSRNDPSVGHHLITFTINLILIAFITGNSSLEPLIEGICGTHHVGGSAL